MIAGIVVFGVLLLLLLAGVPVAFSMGVAALLGFWLSGTWHAVGIIAQRVYFGATSFVLLAVPFYIFTGFLMNAGGMTDRILELAKLLVGRFRGGLGFVNVVDSMIFAGMSGSSVADAGGFGVVDIELMTRGGYDRNFAAALTVAASTAGPVIPPSIPFVIYGAMTGVSVGALFLGGLLPGILMGMTMLITVYLIAVRRSYPRWYQSYSAKDIARIVANGLVAFGCIFLIVGGLMAGAFTPTEAGVAASAYALFVTGVLYRKLNKRVVTEVLWDTARNSAKILFLIGVANAYTYALNLLRVPDAILRYLGPLTTSPALLLLVINAILLLLGCFMETISVMLLVVPTLLPLVMKAGIDPVHFGVVLTLNLMIGQLTPPFGILLYAVAAPAKVQLGGLLRELWPFIVALVVALLLVTYIPAITLSIPRLVMP